MPTLDDLRTASEANLERVLAGLDRRHRAILRAAIEKYGRVQDVPQSVWDEIQRDTENETAVAILLLLMASDEWTTDAIRRQGVDVEQRSIAQLSPEYALTAARRAQSMSSQTLSTLRDRLARKIEDAILSGPQKPGILGRIIHRVSGARPPDTGYTGELTGDSIVKALDDVFTDQRRKTIATDETTGGFSVGQRVAARRAEETGAAKAGGDGAETGTSRKFTIALIWRTEKDNLVCPRCAPLEGRPEEVWGVIFPGGPGNDAHPNCRCWLEPKVVAVSIVQESLMESGAGGHWVTISGEHVLISNAGVILQGPKHLVGKSVPGRSDNTSSYGHHFPGSEQITVKDPYSDRAKSVSVLRNPSPAQAEGFYKRSGGDIRGLRDAKTGDYFLWPATDSNHGNTAYSLGVNYDPSHGGKFHEGPQWSNRATGHVGMLKDIAKWRSLRARK